MAKFKVVRGNSKFQYTPLKNKTGKVYAWQEKNLKTGKSKRVEWDTVKTNFQNAYDKNFAKRISRRKGTKRMGYKQALSRIKEIRRRGGSFDELY